jgi:hypothetical protein
MSPAPKSSTAPRSLADALRNLDDETLGRLLTLRPDLLHPAPSDVTALAARATTGPSVARCIDGLDALELFALSRIALLTATEPAEFAALHSAIAKDCAADGTAIDAAIHSLVSRALVWGDSTSLRAVHPVRDAIGVVTPPPWPAPKAQGADAPVDVDAQAGIHAYEAIAAVRDIIDVLGAEPAPVLRSGGLAVRDFARIMRALGAPAGTAALWLEVAHAAGLIGDDAEATPQWMPTHDADRWLEQSAEKQWVRLARAWMSLPRIPSTATERTNVLAGDDERRAVAVLRRQAMQVLDESGGSMGADAINAVLDFRQPRRAGALRAEVVRALFDEGSRLGIVAAGAITAPGRALLEPGGGKSKDPAESAMAPCMPALVDKGLVQADMTVVVPGPPSAALSKTLRLIADVESRGHATVYRISEGSVRRAFDAGWDASAVKAALAAASSTKVPQPIDFLIDDVARRHGAVRVGIAYAYIRCDAPELLASILTDKRLRPLGLTRIADTVITSATPTGPLIEALREAGYAPAAEAGDGAVVLRPPHEHRAPNRARVSAAVSRRKPDIVDVTVRALRAGERTQRAPRGEVVVGEAGSAITRPTSSTAAVAALRSAVQDAAPVWIAYADNDGTSTEQIVDPIRVGGGSFVAFDHRTESVRTFHISRISGIARIEETSA